MTRKLSVRVLSQRSWLQNREASNEASFSDKSSWHWLKSYDAYAKQGLGEMELVLGMNKTLFTTKRNLVWSLLTNSISLV